MSDLIRREDVFKAIVGLTTHKTVDDIEIFCEDSVAGSEGWLGGIRDALREVEYIPSAEPERKWIPVTEALPKNSEHDWVLGQIRETDSGYLWIPRQVEYRQITDDWFEESIGWFKKNPDHAFEVIAWMPLPERWRGDR